MRGNMLLLSSNRLCVSYVLINVNVQQARPPAHAVCVCCVYVLNKATRNEMFMLETHMFIVHLRVFRRTVYDLHLS